MGKVLNTKKGIGGAPGSTPTLSEVLTAGADAGNKAMTGITTINEVKVYRVLLNQEGTDAPVPIILENSTGVVPVWSYVAPGEYLLTATGLFPLAKTFCLAGHDTNGLNIFIIKAFMPDAIKITIIDGDDLLYYTEFLLLINP